MSKPSEMMDNLSPARDEDGHPITQIQWDGLCLQLAEAQAQSARRLEGLCKCGIEKDELLQKLSQRVGSYNSCEQMRATEFRLGKASRDAEVAELRKQLDAKDVEIAELRTEIATIKAEKFEAGNNQTIFVVRISELCQQLEQAHADIAGLHDQLEEPQITQDDYRAMGAKCAELEAECDQLHKQLAETLIVCNAKDNALSRAKNRIQGLSGMLLPSMDECKYIDKALSQQPSKEQPK